VLAGVCFYLDNKEVRTQPSISLCWPESPD